MAHTTQGQDRRILYVTARAMAQGACALALSALLFPACAGRQASLAERQRVVPAIDPGAEEDVLFACSIAAFASASLELRGQDEVLRHAMSEWVVEGDERWRASVQVYTHPELGPGLDIGTRRERAVGETWQEVAPAPADRARRRELAEQIQGCWAERSAHAEAGRS